MTLAFKTHALAVLRFLCLTTTSGLCGGPLDNTSSCELNLNLFGSKTAPSEESSQCLSANNHLFSQKPLADYHRDLVSRQQCESVALYLVGRHAARHPDEEELAKMTQALEVFRRLVSESDMNKRPSKLINKYLEWKSQFSLEKSNLISELGARYHRELSLRLKRIWPEFFEIKRTRVELASTSKLRTIQSGVEFVKAIDGFELFQGNNLAELACSKSPRDYNPELASGSKCYERLLKDHFMIGLEFHKICKKQIKQKLRDDGISPKLKSETSKSEIEIKLSKAKTSFNTRIAKRIARKFKLNSVPDIKTISGLYDVCTYETSTILGSKSIWCDLFERADLAGLEYLADASIYHKLAKNRHSYLVQASPVLKDILTVFNQETSKAEMSTMKRAKFGFTHDGVLKKVLAALGFFDEDKLAGYSLADLEQFEQTGGVPRDGRLWRAALMVPFSGDIVFALYKCQGGHYKVLTSIAGQPVRVRGCGGPICSLETFQSTYKQMLAYTDQEVCQEVSNSMGLEMRF